MKNTLITALATFLTILALTFIARHYLSAEYDKGYKAAMTEVNSKTKDDTIATQAKVDDNDDKYREAIKERDDAQRSLTDVRNRLNERLRNTGTSISDAATTENIIRLNDERKEWQGLFTMCQKQYGELGEETARLADKVNGLQGYVNSINE